MNPGPTPPPADAAGGVLAGLGLSAGDEEALARQGFVAPDFRRRGGRLLGPYYKLRWRVAGRQRVRYLGQDAAVAQAVRAELERLQAPRKEVARLRRSLAEVRRRLGRAKEALRAPLEGDGFHLHGYAARRRRPRPPGRGTETAGEGRTGRASLAPSLLIDKEVSDARRGTDT